MFPVGRGGCQVWAVHRLYKQSTPASVLVKTSKLCSYQRCKLTWPEIHWYQRTVCSNICFCGCLGFLLQVNFADNEILTFKSERRERLWGSWWSYISTPWRAGKGLGQVNWNTDANWGPDAAGLRVLAIQEVQCLVFSCYASKMPGSSGEIKMSKTDNVDN